MVAKTPKLVAKLAAPAKRRSRQHFWWAVAVAFMAVVLYGAGNRAYGLFDVDEAIFTQATIEMREAQSQHGLKALAMPTYNGEPRYHKPPLIYWVQDLFISVLGNDFMPEGWGLLAARLPSILGALGTVGLLGFGVAFLTGNRRWGMLSAAIMAFNLSFVVIGRAATADGLLNFFSLALVLWVLALLFPRPLPALSSMPTSDELKTRLKQTQRQALMARWGWVVTGLLGMLGFLAKGPIAWVPAGIVALVVLWARPEKIKVWRVLAPVRVVLVIALGLAPWVALLLAKHGSGFFYDFFVVHNLQRFGGDMGNSQSGFMGYYLIVLMVGFFPWVAFVGPALTALVKNPLGVTHKLPFKKALRAGLASTDIHTTLPLLAFAWAIIYVGVFSFSGTKLAHYIVPAYPALAIGVAGWLISPTRKVVPVWQVLVWGFLGFTLAGIALLATPLVEGLRSTPLTGWLADVQLLLGFEWPPADMQAAAVLRQGIPIRWGFYAAGFAMLITTVALMAVMRGKARFLPVLGIAWALALMIVAFKIVSVVWAYTQYPLAFAAQSLRSFPSNTVLVHHGLHKPSVRLLSGMPFIKTDSPVQVVSLLQNLPSGANEIWVVVEVQDIQPLLAELKPARAGMVLDAKCIAGTCLVGLAPVKPVLNN